MLTIKIDTKNSAFDGDNREGEIERCLNEVIDKVNQGYNDYFIHDINGNNIGSWKLTK